MRKLSKGFRCPSITEEAEGDFREKSLVKFDWAPAAAPQYEEAARSSTAPQFAPEPATENRWTLTKQFVYRKLSDRVDNAKSDVHRLLLTPINCVALPIFACFTACCSPNNGRKLYQSAEQLQFDGKVQMPCFSTDRYYGQIPELEQFVSPQYMEMI